MMGAIFELVKGTGEYTYTFQGHQYGPFPGYPEAVYDLEKRLTDLKNKIDCRTGACDNEDE